MIIMMKSQIDFRAKKRGQRGARATSRIEDDLIKILIQLFPAEKNPKTLRAGGQLAEVWKQSFGILRKV